jgi:predicted nucleic acid-binding protein
MDFLILHADLLLIDDAAGRAEAKRRSLRVTERCPQR